MTKRQMEIFQFLNALRRDGSTNMFGAAPWIENYFAMSKKEAREWLIAWMNWAEENPKNLEA